jgi:MFS family permease
MIRSRGFGLITTADFVVRSAYQMGKSPLLPIYAAALGAGDIFLGLIVSVSTLTGMVLKPFVGMLSDRWGRRIWLLIGTAFFALLPFVYRFVSTPEQLFALRVVHGLATAIYGPVTLAYVAELSRTHRAERLGWFSMARNAGYVVGPAAAGWMLLTMEPVAVFTIIGLLSSAALIPVLLLPETAPSVSRPGSQILRQALNSLQTGGRTPAVWLTGGLEANIFVAVYAVRTFVPLLVLHLNASVALAGAFLAVQEAVHLAVNPIGGRLSDRFGHLHIASAGMLVLGAGLLLLSYPGAGLAFLAPAVFIGIAQGMVFPSTVALVSARVDSSHLGVSMGLVGSMKNAGKVAGPVLAGVLIYWLDFAFTFRLMAAILLLGAALVWLSAHYTRRVAPDEEAVPA